MRNVSLFLIIALAMMTACKTDKKAVELKDTRWLLETLGGEKLVFPADSKEAFIVFQSDEAAYHGTAGCNNLGGGYELGAAGALKFQMGFSTMMACEDMKIEDAFVKMMGNVDSYKIDGDQLSLIGGGQTLASFKAAKEVKNEK